MTVEARDAPRTFLLYLLAAFGWSWLFWMPEALAAQGVLTVPEGVGRFLRSPFNPAAFGPLVAALAVTTLLGGRSGCARFLHATVFHRFPKRWLVVGAALPLALYPAGILLARWLWPGSVELERVTDPMTAAIGFIVILLTAGPLQEELGWRGLAQSTLRVRWGACAAGALVGVVWWLWHIPLVFIERKFLVNTPPEFLALGLVITSTSVLMGWLVDRAGGNVLPALLYHTSMNWALWIVVSSLQFTWPALLVMAGPIGVGIALVCSVPGLRSAGDRS